MWAQHVIHGAKYAVQYIASWCFHHLIAHRGTAISVPSACSQVLWPPVCEPWRKKVIRPHITGQSSHGEITRISLCLNLISCWLPQFLKMHFKQKLNLFFLSPPPCMSSQELLPDYLLSRTTQQVMYVLENVSLQLKHRTSVLANSNGTDLTEQEMCDSIHARSSFLPFWRQFIYSQTGQICAVMHWSIT